MKVQYIDHMGNDDSVVNAARVSFNKHPSNFTNEQNHKLIRYLVEHKHEIPFAHTAITLRVQAPISIRTQAFKHKVGFVENEQSRRYISTLPEYFLPVFRSKPDGNIKQGSGDIHERSDEWQREYTKSCCEAIALYDRMIKDNISPEQARFILPQGVLTEWVWTGSLLAFARFYNLRTDPHAQKEIQTLAKMVGEIIESLYPVSWHALTSNRRPTMDRQDIKEANDPINPNHYKTQSGVECIEVASLFPYSLGNAIKYAWRAGRKDNLKQDLKKCEWYLNRAIVNYEIVFLKPHTEAARKAWLKLEKVLGELPERNAEILSNIIQGDLQGALSLLDDWITELD